MKTKSRGNGQGSVYKPKGSSNWTAQYVCGWKPSLDGSTLVPVKRTKGGFKRKDDAVLYIAELKNASAKARRLTLQQLYDEWEPFYSPRVGRSTMVNYAAAYKHFARFHNIFVDLITAADLQECIDACPSGKRTKQNMKCTAGLLWHYAYDRELIDRDITQNLYVGKDPTVKREPITEQELEVIRQAIGTVPYAEYVFAQCYLGFRPCEFLSLRKSDVTTVGEQLILTGGSKTEAGRDRAVPVPPPIVDIIVDRMVQPGTDLLFPRLSDLKPMSHDYYNKHVFQPMMKKLNIAEGKTPYCARHTYSDMLKNVAADDRVKAALMGHTSYDFTRKAYQSTDIQELIDAANAIK